MHKWKNRTIKIFVICTVMLSLATEICITLLQPGYAWSTHMTSHNLADNVSIIISSTVLIVILFLLSLSLGRHSKKTIPG